MRLLSKGFRAVNMVFTANESIVASTQLNLFSRRTEYSLANKLNGTEQRSFDEAVATLNALQNNAATVKKSLSRLHNSTCTNVKKTECYLGRLGVSLEDLDQLSVIHVAGTKGKGSTCALVQSILQNLNVKTGFFSSPHLLNITERIQLNGAPISRVQFTQYFWDVYGRLDSTKQHARDMPAYFKFLTVMSYYVFLKEKVDVAIVEVGIGGEYDCTNVIRNTQTVGITSLGLDHTQLLGGTYRDIAWQKSGIIKPGSSVYTTHQNDECLSVLVERAQEKHAKLQLVPEFHTYKYDNEAALSEITSNPTKFRNSSLAIQLCFDWLRKNPSKISDPLIHDHLMNSDDSTLPEAVVNGLLHCYWPGRCQVVIRRNITFHIDGAHTADSLKLCVDWFNNQTKTSHRKKVLIFNSTGDRDSHEMLKMIFDNVSSFDEAVFSPNIASPANRVQADSTYTTDQSNHTLDNVQHWTQFSASNKAQAFACIVDVLKYLENTYGDEEIEVLVTGSLHLVGAVMRTLSEY